MTTNEMLLKASAAKYAASSLSDERKNEALRAMADSLVKYKAEICKANALDLKAASGTMPDVMLDRLRLDGKRIDAMAAGMLEVSALPDPIGKIIRTVTRPNGLVIQRVSVPMGVVAIIYESRPNVTSDAAAICLKSGNVCVLRCGKEAHLSADAITNALRRGLEACFLPKELVNLVDDVSKESANELMTANGLVDLLIPRGGKGLISACVRNATVPCIQTGMGICHIYVDATADFDTALSIIDNAKTSRPSVCNAAEVCLVHKNIASDFLPLLKKKLVDDRIKANLIPVELRCDRASAGIIGGVDASETDFDTEFLGYTLAVAVVDSLDGAIAHIEKHSTHHSDAIVTRSDEAAAIFTAAVDSAAVYVNASTRFTDGGEFGCGCEIGISTQKLHARGPMGTEELTTYKYVIRGNGQIR